MKELLPLFDEPLYPCGAPLIMAGPCSAETREQTLATARGVAGAGVRIFRAGLWKPRTMPGCFEGVGAKGLPWLREAKRETGMLTATEVATPAHVRSALRSGVDILWIGARTVVNPFAVQAIADTLREYVDADGGNLRILVKNPVSPDLDLWIGALTRIYNAGVRRLGAIARGFSSANPGIYRNPPCWQIPIELKRRYPRLPLIFDPSHTGGKRELIAPLSQEALDMGFDGLMIETHESPDCAWSDREQQLTPVMLREVMDSLVVRTGTAEDSALEMMRREIDLLDAELISLLARRMDVSRRIGEFKKEHDMTAVQIGRHDAIMRDRAERAADAGLNPALVETLFKAVHEESVRCQLEVMKRK